MIKKKTMKKILITALFATTINLTAQTVVDARDYDRTPAYYYKEVKYEFKRRSVIGVPGEGNYSGLMTFAPWGDNSGDEHHQLNFNRGGIFYRNGLPDNSSWNSWTKILIEDANGRVGVGTSNPLSRFQVSGDNSSTASTALFSIRKNEEGYGLFSGILGSGTSWLQSGHVNNTTFYGLTLQPNGGNVGIGTTTPDAKLSVNGKIHAKEVKVDLTGWPDYVFTSNYKLPTLASVEKHIKEKGHLQNIPSAKEVAKNGIELGEMNKKLLQKIEELTLYTIQQEKKIALSNKSDKKLLLIIQKLEKRIQKLEK
jgi:hypothetical protein